MSTIFLIAYVAAGYWAVGQTIYYNKIVFHQFGQLFMQKIVLALILGWILIPVALILKLTGHR